MTAAPVLDWLGATERLDYPPPGEWELAAAAEGGLPTAAVDALLEHGRLSLAEVESLVLPRRTLTHRKRRGEPLTVDESDKLLRAARLLALAEETFQSVEKAHLWLRRANRALGGSVPLELARTSHGARLVEHVLGRISHGVFS
jgi:putative toxin-antitoxin system antitoxin component (TIGR02293 family)